MVISAPRGAEVSSDTTSLGLEAPCVTEAKDGLEAVDGLSWAGFWTDEGEDLE